MGARVAVAGASGYAGGELLRLLTAHPDLEIGPLAAGSNAGTPVTEVHPNLAGLTGRVFGPADPGALADADLVFMALPHAEAAALAGQLPAHAKVVDLGAGFRLADPRAWARFYGGPHPGRWTYGLPELPGARERIRDSARVAVPGCYATAAILALAPLLASGLAEPADIVIVAASGTSGAGRAARTELLGSEVMGAVSAYQAGGTHRHTPEIEQALTEAAAEAGLGPREHCPPTGPASTGLVSPRERPGGVPRLPASEHGPCEPVRAAGAGRDGGNHAWAGGAHEHGDSRVPEAAAGSMQYQAGNASIWGRSGSHGGVTVSFTPSLAPMPRGILATCTARLAGTAARGGAATDATGLLRAALADAYAGEPFVHLLSEGRWPSTGATAGSNAAHLQVAANIHAGRAVAVAAIDNLGKGAAGQALQVANLMLGLPETAGLTAHGVAP